VTTLTRSRLVLAAAVGVVSVIASCAGLEIQAAATALAVTAATVISWRWDTSWVPDRDYQRWKRDIQSTIDALDRVQQDYLRVPEHQRQWPENRELWLRTKDLKMVLEAQYEHRTLDMPILDPIKMCSACGYFGALFAELAPGGLRWVRTCPGCGTRWVEPGA
jgi:hypothetical protein